MLRRLQLVPLQALLVLLLLFLVLELRLKPAAKRVRRRLWLGPSLLSTSRAGLRLPLTNVLRRWTGVAAPIARGPLAEIGLEVAGAAMPIRAALERLLARRRGQAPTATVAPAAVPRVLLATCTTEPRHQGRRGVATNLTFVCASAAAAAPRGWRRRLLSTTTASWHGTTLPGGWRRCKPKARRPQRSTLGEARQPHSKST